MSGEGAVQLVDYELALANTFQDALRGLAPARVAAVMETLAKLQRGNAALHLHALQGMDWVSFGVNQGGLRVIGYREDRTLLLAWVDSHDEAYAWARRNVPRRYGRVLRIRRLDIETVAPAASSPASASSPRSASPDDVEVPPGPLADVRDKALRYLDVGPTLARVLRSVPDEDTLLELCEHLKPALAGALLSLVDDPDDLQGIVARYARDKQGATTTLADAVRAPVNAERLWVVPPEQAALEAALAADAAVWAVFLHPTQKRLVTMSTSGPMLVLGGPGTGKTVVALHRVRHLAERALASSDPRPVLLTTFSRVLAAQLCDGLQRLCADRPELAAATTTLTLTQAARAVVQAAGGPDALLTDEDIGAAWAEALAVDVDGRGRRFYERERDEVVLPRGITTEERYLRAPRPGRGERLERRGRQRVWAVLHAFEEALVRRGGDDAGGLARRAMQALAAGVVVAPYAAVVVDEVQDASPWELALLAALATPPGAHAPGADRLFLVGDGHQRLYQKPTSLRACGIEVRGRSARLRLNYRTTQGICAAALDLVQGVPLDVLDVDAAAGEGSGEGSGEGRADDAGRAPVVPDDDAAGHGYRSVRAGPRPREQVFASDDDEAAAIAALLGSSDDAGPPTLLLARTRAALLALQERLRDRGLVVPLLGELDAVPVKGRAVLATLHRSKGLEAPRVVLFAQQQVPQRFPGGDDEARVLWERQERLLQYVGMTRARDVCIVTRVVVGR
jgi:hypothetical protein